MQISMFDFYGTSFFFPNSNETIIFKIIKNTIPDRHKFKDKQY